MDRPKWESRTVSFPSPAASNVVAAGGGHVRRFALRETSGAATATYELYDGSNTFGQLIDTVEVAASGSIRESYRLGAFPFYGGLYLNVLAGTFAVVFVVQLFAPGYPHAEPVIVVGSEVGVIDLAGMLTEAPPTAAVAS